MLNLGFIVSAALLIPNCVGDSAFLTSFANVVKYATDGKFEFTQPESTVGSLQYAPFEESSGHPTISTTSGEVIGSTVEEAHAFFSVPYASPPVGNLRFRDTVSVQPSSEPINATVPNHITCRQRPQDECSAGYCITDQREDCLVLNVFVPRSVDLSSATPQDNLPVLLWIHGGAFISGTGTSPKNDGRWLSNATCSIVVTINYRLGAYGFLVYNKGGDPLKGNQGLKDQQMAMRWVQENIANFGGDKDRVTIFGESAGGQSVMWHMLSDVSRQLYRRAILQSNAPIFPHQTPEEAMDVTNRLLVQLNCSGENEFECLLNAPAEELDRFYVIMAASALDDDAWSAVEPYRPIIDGVEWTDQPLNLFKEGKWNTDKEYIFGANTQEVEILQFYVPGDQGLPRLAFRKINTMFLGDEAGRKAADYYEELVGPNGDDYSNVLGVEAGDGFFICSNRAMSRFAYQTAQNPDGFYNYMFDHPPDGKYCDEVFPKNETCGYVYHSAEIMFVFRSGPGFGYHFNDDDINVSDQFSKYWGNFARNGDPNDDSGGPSFQNVEFWPPYVKETYPLPKKDSQEEKGYDSVALWNGIPLPWSGRPTEAAAWSNIHIQPSNPFVESRYKEEICDFWDSLNFYVEMPPTTESPTTTAVKSTKPTESPTTTAVTSTEPTESTGASTSTNALSDKPMSTTSGSQHISSTFNIAYSILFFVVTLIYV